MKKTILILSTFIVMIFTHATYAAKPPNNLSELVKAVVTPIPIAETSTPSVSITAEIAENVGVVKIVLFYRPIDVNEFKAVTMHADRNGEYRYVVSQEEIAFSGFVYYIELTDFSGNTFLHGFAHAPLTARFTDYFGEDVVAKYSGDQTTWSKKIRHAQGLSAEPLWKNKWLWLGIGLLATAAIANDDGGSNEPSKPGFSIVVEGPPPETTAP